MMNKFTKRAVLVDRIVFAPLRRRTLTNRGLLR